MKSLIPKNKLSRKLPKGIISFTPDNELVIHYQNQSFYFRYGKFVYIIFLAFLGLLWLVDYSDFKYTWQIVLIATILQLIVFIQGFQSENNQRITFNSNGFTALDFKYNITETIELQNKYQIDFKIKVIDNIVEIKIENESIYFDDVQQIPKVVDHLATLWNLEYADTYHLDEDTEVLTYSNKQLLQANSKSRLIIEENDQHLIIRDVLDPQRYFSFDKDTYWFDGHKFKKALYRINDKTYTIQVEGLTTISTPNYSIIQIKISTITGEQEVFFTSKRRYGNDVSSIYHDINLIYDTLKAQSDLSYLKIEKLLK